MEEPRGTPLSMGSAKVAEVAVPPGPGAGGTALPGAVGGRSAAGSSGPLQGPELHAALSASGSCGGGLAIAPGPCLLSPQVHPEPVRLQKGRGRGPAQRGQHRTVRSGHDELTRLLRPRARPPFPRDSCGSESQHRDVG